ncbi:MAG: hypothetical protein KIT27_06115 [Legionellales bacterium]|nr:hypothetical protein [Legionellales bacterium]
MTTSHYQRIAELKQKAFDLGRKMVATQENMLPATGGEPDDLSRVINELNKLDTSKHYTSADFIPKA